MKNTIFDILYALDKDHAKTHKSHTKKINHVCKAFVIHPNARSKEILVVQPPIPDTNHKLVFYHLYELLDSINNIKIGFTLILRFKEKKNSRSTINCQTSAEVQSCLDKKYKIYDCTLANFATSYSRYILDILGKLVWKYLRSEREVFKQKVLDCEPVSYDGAKVTLTDPPYETHLSDVELTDLTDIADIHFEKGTKWDTKLTKFVRDGKRMSHKEVRATLKKCMKKPPKKG